MQSTFEGAQNLKPQLTASEVADVQRHEQERISANAERRAKGEPQVPGAAGRESIADCDPEAVDRRWTVDFKAQTSVPQNEPVV